MRMKKLLLLLFFACSAQVGLAQRTEEPTPIGEGTPPIPPDPWKQHADSVFEHLDRSPVSTGLLANYGFALKNYTPYQGTALASANLLQSLGEWRLLYAAMQASTFNANTTLPSLRTANQRISQAEQQAPGVVSIATLLVRYDRFRDDAAPAGLLNVSNGQVYDVPGRPASPYEQRTLVALSPLTNKVNTRSPQFSFASQLRFSNAAPAITAVEFDAGEGLGYRFIAWDQLLTATYPADGTYTLRFRLTCSDGSVLLSQARFDVSQPPAARYEPTGSTNVITYNSAALFTNTRTYTSYEGLFGFPRTYAATGKVTVAYANGNTSGTIRKPLIVIEGYDPSSLLKANGVNSVPDYDYDYFVQLRDFGAININYTDFRTGLNVNFNDQLSSQYDLIFLNFANGTDYMQRNAYLVERLIQWVNDTKAVNPTTGIKEKNIVLGMSMGGLIARYALRDMEQRQASGAATFSHDTRLYISHEAPHQGANVPLGFQYMVKGVANMSIAGVATGADLNPNLGGFAKLLLAPATQQLLLYQTSVAGNNLHNTWLNEYRALGYPTQCRNVATSNGSECGKAQLFAPYAVLLDVQGNGLLDDPNNNYANATSLGVGLLAGLFLPGSFPLGFAIGYLLSLGNYEGRADFVVNALPNQQQQRIYHGRFLVCKDIVFGALSVCVLDYAEDKYSTASMLAYDSAPGGVYDINKIGGNVVGQLGTSFPLPLYRIVVQPTFCFVPTTSALDIGGGSTTLTPSALTASYSGASPPAAPFNTPFANFVTASRENQTHILWNGLNSKWAYQEMQSVPQAFNCQAFCQIPAQIRGGNAICAGIDTEFTLDGIPATGVTVTWLLSSAASYTVVSQSNSRFVVNSTVGNGSGTIYAFVESDCGRFTVQKNVSFGGVPSPVVQFANEPGVCNYNMAYYHIANYSSLYNYTISNRVNAAGGAVRGADFWVKSGGGITGGSFTLTARNDCGFELIDVDVEYPPCTGPTPTYTLAPNPATDEVMVEPEAAPATTNARAATASPAAPTGIATVRVYDSYGRLRLEQAGHGAASLRLRVGALPAGLYVVHVLHGSNQVSRQQLQLIR